MKGSARSQKIQVVTASDYLEFMKCPMKVHGSVLSERLFHDIPSCSPPPTGFTKASGHAPPGPPPGPLAPSITSWSAPVKICQPGQTKNPWGTINEPLNEICSPPTKISKAGKNSSGIGDATAKVVTGFNIEQSFRRLSCEENNDSREDKGKVIAEPFDSVKHNQKENIVTENSHKRENIYFEKETNNKKSINYVLSNKPENIENSENENPWITVQTKTGPLTQTRTKANKENKAIPPSSFQSQLAKQLSDGAKKLPSPSEDFTTKFALRLLQTQPQTQQQQKQPQQKQSQQKQQQHRPQKEKRQSPKQKIDKKESCDALRGSPKNYNWRIGALKEPRCPRFQPEWRMATEQEIDSKNTRAQQLLRKRTRSESKSFIGTRIIYERKFLMQCRASPLAKTPPANLPNIPGITTKDSEVAPPRENGTIPEEPEKTDVDDDQFEMDL